MICFKKERRHRAAAWKVPEPDNWRGRMPPNFVIVVVKRVEQKVHRRHRER